MSILAGRYEVEEAIGDKIGDAAGAWEPDSDSSTDVASDDDQLRQAVDDAESVLPTEPCSHEDDKLGSSCEELSTDDEEQFRSEDEVQAESCEDGDSHQHEPDADTSPELFPPESCLSTNTTLVIFDWDDTILPSTWLQLQGLTLDPDSVPTEEQRSLLEALAVKAVKTLESAKLWGTVIFITNAEEGWIQRSCQKFLPSLLESLESVKLLSARSAYEPMGEASPTAWKLLAFESEIEGFIDNLSDSAAGLQKNLISLGDSKHEREALVRTTMNMTECYAKSVKFVDRPSVEQLTREHELVNGSFPQIMQHLGMMDLCLRS